MAARRQPFMTLWGKEMIRNVQTNGEVAVAMAAYGYDADHQVEGLALAEAAKE